MGRQRRGSVVERKGKIYARVQFSDEQGRRRDIWRRADNRKEARSIAKQLLREVDDHGETTLDSHSKTFADLASYFEQHYLKPAEYVDGRKIAGYRSVINYKCYMHTLRTYFGNKRLRSVTYSDIRTFKSVRLRTPTRGTGTRALASVHRELALLRKILNVALREGWILKNPFNAGDTLISLADETKRERILSHEEECRMLAACTDARAHLRPLLIFLLDTGCRQGEAFKLKWRDVDLEARMITLQAFNTKTARERQVAVTIRLHQELCRLSESDGDPDALIFGITSNVRNSFASVIKLAGIDGLRRHDLRHTHASRLDELGFSLAKIGGQLGHTKVQTTLRYVNRDTSAIQRVAIALDGFNAGMISEPPATSAELVN
ncbi:MAG: tyrosine-type recombinase/integrase [Acidobacteriota bacterium]|nr:tyrosine-type recombinase/integrase [Acidobacteriota bacterium]